MTPYGRPRGTRVLTIGAAILGGMALIPLALLVYTVAF